MRYPLFYLDADDGAGSGGTADSAKDTGENKTDAAAGGNTGGKTFTQEELDKHISDRLKRERKSWETTLEDEKKKAAMTEAEKLKAEKEESDKKLSEIEQKADARAIKSDAKILLSESGVKSERIGAALKLMDLSGVEVTDGEPDAAALKKAVEGFAKEYPEFVGQTSTTTAGGDFGGGNGKPAITDEWVRTADAKDLQARMPEVEAFYKSKRK
jgi:hypothetical protein